MSNQALQKKINKGKINETKGKIQNQQIENRKQVLHQYINHYKNKVKSFKGSGIKRGANVTFYNSPKELLKKLKLIIGEILAGNTNGEMRNTGVAILDILLKSSLINKSHHEKFYKKYFKDG